VEFKLPDLGENIEGAEVLKVLVKEGDTVAAEQPLVELETDKATIEVPSPVAGRIEKVLCKPQQHVKVGQAVFVIAEAAGAAAERPAAEKPAAEKPAAEKPAADKPAEKASAPEAKPAEKPAPAAASAAAATAPSGMPVQATVPAGPATRKLARELGVDLTLVKGSGPYGRITLEDVKGFVKTSLARPGAAAGAAAAPVAPPLPDFSAFGPIDRQPLSGIRRKIADNLAFAWRTCPQVTQFDEADVTDLEAGRKRFGKQLAEASEKAPKITMTVIAVKAVVAALRKFPQFNSSLDLASAPGEEGGRGALIIKRYFNIGIAVDTEHGLVVPVLKDADKKSLVQLATELEDLSARAKVRKLGPDDMKGATFTITNLGGIGGTAFSPIVNWPEVAILGLARSQQKMVVRAGAPEVRLMMPLCLTYDHRVIDGADGARFTTYLGQILSDPVVLMMGA
jgi:pyruvate dehydrogenase E2 component (dihydrolipoamide acetyltransferase)